MKNENYYVIPYYLMQNEMCLNKNDKGYKKRKEIMPWVDFLKVNRTKFMMIVIWKLEWELENNHDSCPR